MDRHIPHQRRHHCLEDGGGRYSFRRRVIEKRAFVHMPKGREAGVLVVVYYGSRRHFPRASTRRFVWLGQNMAEEKHAIVSKASLGGDWMEYGHRIDSI